MIYSKVGVTAVVMVAVALLPRRTNSMSMPDMATSEGATVMVS